jgi:hypothetical protein
MDHTKNWLEREFGRLYIWCKFIGVLGFGDNELEHEIFLRWGARF